MLTMKKNNHKKKPIAIWTEQLNIHIDKLRDNVDISTDFSLHETLHTSWQNMKALPPSLMDSYKNSLAKRQPVPADLINQVTPCEFHQQIRYVSNEKCNLDFGDQPINIMTISSGGTKGAYGAGLITGWTERGNMPEFDLMMGVSTGAIIAFLTFIGKINELHHFYNEYSTDDLVEKQVIQGLMAGTSVYDNTQFKQLLYSYIDDVAIKRLADEANKGRYLLVGTTNLDRGLPVTWDLTAIARTNNPFARQLIADVMLASCAIPVIFPPVVMPVADEAGNEYDELHVDGGASMQLLIDIPVNQATVYAIINQSFTPTYQPTGMDVFDIGNKALDTALANGILGDMARLYVNAQRSSSDFHATWIPQTFTPLPNELFDVNYMRELFTLGYECAQREHVWHTTPPHF